MTLAFKNILFIGFGLLGGSIAKTLKKISSSIRIFAYDPLEESLTQASREGVIDNIYAYPDSSLPEVDLVILAVAPQYISTYLDFFTARNYKGIITDISSVKKTLLKYWESTTLPPPFQFISSHPMAGSEKSGYMSSNSSLFENAACILCPYEAITSYNTIADLSTFWILLGCQTPVILNPDEHDQLIGLISHFPHLVATILTQIAKKRASSSSLLKTIIGPGFKDTTRIAQGNPHLWKTILSDNSENLLPLLQELQKEIQYLEKALLSPELIEKYLEDAAFFRKKIHPTLS